MTKAELVIAVSNAMWLQDIPNDKATNLAIIEAFTGVVKRAVVRGDEVEIRGFGRFYARRYKARKARNLHRGESMELPARTLPMFRPAKEFIESVKINHL